MIKLLRQNSKYILNNIGHELYNSYIKELFNQNKFNYHKLIRYTKIKEISNKDSEIFIKGLENKLSHLEKLDLKNPEVNLVRIDDIELKEEDKYGQIILISKDGAQIKYGKKGIAPSIEISPLGLLCYNLEIPANSFGILDIEKHVPFQIEGNPKENLTNNFVTLYKLIYEMYTSAHSYYYYYQPIV